MKFSHELRRLLRYVRPYTGRLSVAVILMGFVGLGEGLVALMIVPLVDFVLNPHVAGARVPLEHVPFINHTVYLNSFLPSSVRWVWSVFAISLCILFLGKALAEFFGSTMIQYVGLAAVTDLRNQIYAKVIYQPLEFFQLHQTGRLISAVINDVERVRSALSEWLADFFRQLFTLVALV
ncbi:MAG: ABC transporter transmembrane domain-containing protein, partial [Candidatus Acidiferrales bacterium]